MASFVRLNTQCASSFSLGPDTAICASETLILFVPNNYDTYQWQNNNVNSLFVVSNPGTYYCVTSQTTGNNLINNGNFEQGNVGFTSDYNFYPIADVFGPQASYGIINNANTWFNPFNPCADHTSASGLMMVIDGSSFNGGNDAIWCQNVAVQVGVEYRLSYWIQSVTNSTILANIRLKINGIVVDTELAPLGACNWQEREFFWTSNLTGNANFCLFDLELSGNGNDFALDDISLVEICNYSDTIVVSLSPIDTLFYQDVICLGDSAFLGNAWQTQAGFYYDGVMGSPCDNIIQTHLVFNNIDTSFIQMEICPGDSVFLENNWQLQEGFYYDVIHGTSCDEILATQLLWSSLDTTSMDEEICQGDSFYVAGNWQTQAGFYYDVISGTPCDEILATQLLWSSADTATIEEEICQGDSFYVAGNWQTEAGFYYEVIQGAGCDAFIETNLILKGLPFANAGSDLTASYEQIVTLTANSTSTFSQYLWSSSNGFTSSNQSIDIEVVSPVQLYYLQLTEDGCASFDTLSIYGLPLNLAIKVPNAFTPNSDGVNDVFQVLNTDEFQTITLKIYNRWGELIHFSKGVNPTWLGEHYSGKSCPVGSYVFYIEALPYGDSEQMTLSGTLSLIK